MAETFPRSTELPKQSPQFWVAHKDRYLRQLLIRDIEQLTGRCLIVYFADDTSPQCAINSGDDVFVAELLQACIGMPVDLMIETQGGETDATEKICSLLRSNNLDLRVVVPRRAKSNGTVVALAGSEILMGIESELGPIDPSISNIPVEFIINAPAGTIGPIDVQAANAFRNQTRKLATELLATGMLKGSDQAVITQLVEKIATRDVFHSHGSVINASEAASLGLKVIFHDGRDALWAKFTLLRAMYQFDCREQRYLKIFEGNHVSLVVNFPQPTTP